MLHVLRHKPRIFAQNVAITLSTVSGSVLLPVGRLISDQLAFTPRSETEQEWASSSVQMAAEIATLKLEEKEQIDRTRETYDYRNEYGWIVGKDEEHKKWLAHRERICEEFKSRIKPLEGLRSECLTLAANAVCDYT